MPGADELLRRGAAAAILVRNDRAVQPHGGAAVQQDRVGRQVCRDVDDLMEHARIDEAIHTMCRQGVDRADLVVGISVGIDEDHEMVVLARDGLGT